MYVCKSSITLVHRAKTVGRNKVPFGRDTQVDLSNIVLYRGPSPLTRRGDLGVETPQFAAMPLQGLWPLLLLLLKSCVQYSYRVVVVPASFRQVVPQ